jgi:hypothetical protein
MVGDRGTNTPPLPPLRIPYYIGVFSAYGTGDNTVREIFPEKKLKIGLYPHFGKKNFLGIFGNLG